jgi:fatty-acyl-CoA synthase
MIDYGALIQGPRVHGRLYCDPDVFAAELDAIWHRVWVYVGHESEVPQPGDYVRRQIGAQPVIMIRGADGNIRVLFNRCRHRGNLICHKDKGGAQTITCPYHGWSYAADGALIGPTFKEAYINFPKDALGLTPLPRQGAYRGLVFASVAKDGIALDEHLGPAKEFIDLFMDLSPTGEVDIDTGVQKLRYAGNWKMLPENSLEGDYHGPFIHRIAFELHGRRTGLDLTSLMTKSVPDVIRSLPGGHMVEDYRGASMGAPKAAPPPWRLKYVAQMEARYGAERARMLTSTIPPLVYVFPNLLYVMTHIRRVQPVSVDETFVYYQPMLLKGAPDEVNEARLREHEFGFGPAGFISPDDIEIMERNQLGLAAQGDGWTFIGRGAHRTKTMPDGGTSGFTMDENHLRGMWQHYRTLMQVHG